MNLERLRKDTAHETVTVENGLGAHKSMSVYDLLTNSNRGWWPCTANGMASVIFLITEHIGDLQPTHRNQWNRMSTIFGNVKSCQMLEAPVPRSVVGNFFTILLVLQTQSAAMDGREANLLHSALGDFIEAYMTALIRANHSLFINTNT